MKGNIVKKRGEKGRRLAWLSKSFLSINPLSAESVSLICSCCHFTSLTHTHTTPHALTELIDDRLSLHSILPAAVSSQRLHQTTGTFTFAHHHKHPHTHTQPCTHILLTYQHSILLFLSSNHSLSLSFSLAHTHTQDALCTHGNDGGQLIPQLHPPCSSHFSNTPSNDRCRCLQPLSAGTERTCPATSPGRQMSFHLEQL